MYPRKALLLISFLSFAIFLYILAEAVNGNYLLSFDHQINSKMITLHTPILTDILLAITNIGGVVGNTVFTMGALLFLSYKKWYKERLFYLLSFLGSVILFLSLKQLIARPRPISDIIDISHYSFPSGHATLSMTTVLILYFIISKRFHSKFFKYIFLALGIIWAVSIAFSRIYLNVHWLSDVLAGLFLAIFWVTFVSAFFYKK